MARDIGAQLYVDPGQRQRFVAELHQRDEIRNFAAQRRKRGGETFWVSLNARCVRAVDGRVLHYEGSVIDISARKQAEEELRRSEELYRVLVSSLNDGFFMTDANGYLIFANDAFARIYGFDAPAQLIGTHMQHLIAPADRERPARSFSEALASGIAPKNFEFLALTQDGQVVDAEVKPNIVVLQDGTVTAQGVLIDISERKQWEWQRQQLQKTASLNRMAGAIAHHFNNKLQAVMGNLELAIDDAAPGTNIQAMLQESQKAARQAVEVSSLMLLYLGQAPGVHTRLDLSQICKQEVNRQRAALPAAIALETEILSDQAIIQANPELLRRILSSLIQNAVDAISDQPGRIRIAVRILPAAQTAFAHLQPVDWQPDAPTYACLKVFDNGCGLRQDQLDMVFDPFYSTKFIGRGLGLPVVLGVARVHRGAAAVESLPGSGTILRVLLSLEEQPPRGAEGH